MRCDAISQTSIKLQCIIVEEKKMKMWWVIMSFFTPHNEWIYYVFTIREKLIYESLLRMRLFRQIRNRFLFVAELFWSIAANKCFILSQAGLKCFDSSFRSTHGEKTCWSLEFGFSVLSHHWAVPVPQSSKMCDLGNPGLTSFRNNLNQTMIETDDWALSSKLIPYRLV